MIEAASRLERRAIQRELARRGMKRFVGWTKKDYEFNWHHDYLCAKLDAFADGRIKRLMVFMPPRHGKSELTSRRFPAYMFGKNPDTRIIACSYSADLASLMNRDVQRIMDSPEYLELFPASRLYGRNVRTVADGSALRNSEIFEIPGRRGFYKSAGVGGPITGVGADRIVIDDPIKNQEEAESTVYREKVWDWYGSTLYTRLEKDAGICLTLTRWHEDDLAGRLLKAMKDDPTADQWEIVSFPAIREDLSNPEDPRELAAALWPNKYDNEAMARIKGNIGSRWFNALYQQRPSAQEGGLLKRAWMANFYRALPDRFDEIISSWDLTFKDTRKADFVVGQVWGRRGGSFYLLDQVRDRMDFVAALAAVRMIAARWPKARAHFVEDKANGPAVIATLKKDLPAIVAVNPEGSKEARASAVSPLFEAGNVYLPDPSLAPWISDYIEELANFPNAANDDQVDATSQALIRLRQLSSDFPADLVSTTVETLVGFPKEGLSW